MYASLVSAELFDALKSSAENPAHLVLTPTSHSAATLRSRFDTLQRAAAEAGGSTRPVWQPARVLAWPQWLSSLWSSLILHGVETRTLLNPAQEDLLWRELVTATLEPANLPSAAAIARLARSAFALAEAYAVPTSRLVQEADTEDTRAFAAWAASFRRLCARHHCVSAASLASELLRHAVQGKLQLPGSLHLHGCLDLSPADDRLMERLRAAGTMVTAIASAAPAGPTTRTLLRADKGGDELRAVAHWLRSFVEARVAAGEVPTVAVVLADPHTDTAALDRTFREVLAPELDFITADPASGPWQIAAGQPLAAIPVLHTLLLLLRGVTQALALDDVTALLLSPHFGPAPVASSDADRDIGGTAGESTATSKTQAAQLDAYAVRQGKFLRPELTFAELQQLAQRSPFGDSTLAWLKPFRAFLAAQGDLSLPRSYADWSATIRGLAAAAGWPGAGPLRPLEFAASRAWDGLLDTVATLDFTGRRVAFPEVFAAMTQQLESAKVSLPTRPPIQVLSADEAAAVPHDAVVFVGANETTWPPPERPHPLLPWRLQAALGMPGTEKTTARDRSAQLANAIFRPATHVLVTYAAEVGDVPQRLSPSLARMSREGGWDELHPSDLIPQTAPPIRPELLVDSDPLPPLTSAHIRGGAHVLKLQAACGFRAFAEIRLQSTEPMAPETGLDAREAGSVLHRALDRFWNMVGSQEALNRRTRAEREATLKDAIDAAFGRSPARDDAWEHAYVRLQKERLLDLLRQWLEVERARPPFTVQGREQKSLLTVGPLELSLRIDRTDQVTTADGSEGSVLVDYKSSATIRPGSWDGDRPDEPQLPLYTLLPGLADVRALAFAKIVPGDLVWAGIQDVEGLLPRAKVVELEQQVAVWREVLTRLAEGFAAGDLSVFPKHYPQTCSLCGQRMLCRLDPATLRGSDDEELLGEASEVDFGQPGEPLLG